MADETSCRDDQVPCGNVLVTKKIAKNGKWYLELSSRNLRICMFQNEWEYFKKSRGYISQGVNYNLSKEKLLCCEENGDVHIQMLYPVKNGDVRNQVRSGFKFVITESDYNKLLKNAHHIDQLGLDEPNTYYTWHLEEGNESFGFFKDREQCQREGELCQREDENRQITGQTLRVEKHVLKVDSPAHLIYNIYLFLIEREVIQLSHFHCAACKVIDVEAYDYKSHSSGGCIADWETKLNLHLDEAKSLIMETYIIELFNEVCKVSKWPVHPHMNNLVYAITQFSNITPEVVNEHKCSELLKHVIQNAYDVVV